MTKDENNPKLDVDVIWFEKEGKFCARLQVGLLKPSVAEVLIDLEGWGETRAQAVVRLEIEIRKTVEAGVVASL